MAHQCKILKPFYQREDVLQITEEILGKYLFTSFHGKLTGGIIIEAESYRGIEDKACHAYNGRKTARTQVMFEEGGIAYVYLCYGIHHLFNIVTHKAGTPHAILIRAIQPTHGLETMLERRNKTRVSVALTGGPGTVAEALGIRTEHSGISLTDNQIWLEDRGIRPSIIERTPRIGVDYAAEHKDLLYRFVAHGC